jgi:hypothetical protein
VSAGLIIMSESSSAGYAPTFHFRRTPKKAIPKIQQKASVQRNVMYVTEHTPRMDGPTSSSTTPPDLFFVSFFPMVGVILMCGLWLEYHHIITAGLISLSVIVGRLCLHLLTQTVNQSAFYEQFGQHVC